jgi:hypothetical protein
MAGRGGGLAGAGLAVTVCGNGVAGAGFTIVGCGGALAGARFAAGLVFRGAVRRTGAFFAGRLPTFAVFLRLAGLAADVFLRFALPLVLAAFRAAMGDLPEDGSGERRELQPPILDLPA